MLGKGQNVTAGEEDAGQEAAHSVSDCKNWPPVHDLSRTVAPGIINIIRWQCGYTGTRVGEAAPGPTDQVETIHTTERETKPRAGSQYETEPATESEERNTLASTPVATRKDRTDTTQYAAAGRNRNKNMAERQNIEAWRSMSTLSGPKRKAMQHVVLHYLRNAGLP